MTWEAMAKLYVACLFLNIIFLCIGILICALFEELSVVLDKDLDLLSSPVNEND